MESMRHIASALLLCLFLGVLLSGCTDDTAPADADTQPPAVNETDSATADSPTEPSETEPPAETGETDGSTEPPETEPPAPTADETAAQLPDVESCKNGVLTLTYTQINDDTRERFFALLDALSALPAHEIDPASYRIAVGSATLELGYGDTPYLLSCTAYGNAVAFEAGQFPLGNDAFVALYNTASTVILGNGLHQENWYFLSQACSYFLADAQTDVPRMARTQIRIYPDSTGSLMYTRQPVKFQSEYRKTDADYLRLCAARDELLLETGALSLLADGTPYFFPIETAHISDTVDLDALWTQFHTESEFAVYATLDDRLAANAVQYPAVY